MKEDNDACMDPPPVPRLTLTTLLTVYIAGLVGIRAHDTLNTRHIHMLTACAFGLVAWILVKRGGTTRWPTLLPLAIAQGIGLVLYILYTGSTMSKSRTRQSKHRSPPYDGFVAVLTVAIATGIMLYGIIPSAERWARHLGVIACVLCGVPAALLVPSMLRRPVNDPATVARIRRAAHASNAVYARTNNQGDANTAKTEFANAEYVHEPTTGARCGIFVNADTSDVIVAFAGSDSKVDWIRTNVNVDTEDLGSLESTATCDGVGGAVHKGILDAWKSIREPVWKAVSNNVLLRGGSGSLIVSGHSLGGAMATVAALDLACQLDRTQLSLITFGSPPVGDATFAKSVAVKVPTSIRVTTISDPVPKLVIRDFVHVEAEYPVVTSVENPVTAHFMASYLRALDAPSGTLGTSRLVATAGSALAILGLSSVLAWRRS